MKSALIATVFLLSAAADRSPVITYSRGSIRMEGAQVTPAAVQGTHVSVGNRLVLGESSALSMRFHGATLRAEGAGEVALLRGDQIQWGGDVAYVSAGNEAIQVVAGDGMVQLRDAEIRLRTTPSGVAVETLRGTARAFGKLGYVAIPESRGLILADSAAQAKPSPLPRAPKLIRPAPQEALRSFRFNWRQEDDAASYRFELASDPTFTETLYTTEVTTAALVETARSLPIGILYWRVSALGKNGFESAPSPAQAVRIAP